MTLIQPKSLEDGGGDDRYGNFSDGDMAVDSTMIKKECFPSEGLIKKHNVKM
jgi:hypothetical protein